MKLTLSPQVRYISMQGNWVGQSEMMLAGPVIEEQ